MAFILNASSSLDTERLLIGIFDLLENKKFSRIKLYFNNFLNNQIEIFSNAYLKIHNFHKIVANKYSRIILKSDAEICKVKIMISLKM